MRKRVYEVIAIASRDDQLSHAYDAFMMLTIIVSILPLAFKQETVVFTWIDFFTAGIFILDYLLRLFTADYCLEKGKASFFLYPFTPMAIIDLLSILPSITLLNRGFRLLKIFRLFKSLRVFRVFKVFRYSKSLDIIMRVIKKQRRILCTVAVLAVGYVFISALIIFNVEPDSFDTFFDAVYWATVSLTTVGYGDIYPVTGIGRVVTMLSSIFGIAIIAMPSGIITAGFMEELSVKDKP